jgi:hypothetical protein
MSFKKDPDLLLLISHKQVILPAGSFLKRTGCVIEVLPCSFFRDRFRCVVQSASAPDQPMPAVDICALTAEALSLPFMYV